MKRVKSADNVGAQKVPLAVWQATHDQLLRGDAKYRKRFHAFLIVEICLACVLLVFYLPFFGVRLFAPALNVATVLGLAAIFVGLALRQILHQRRCIRLYLKLNQDTGH